MIGIAIYAIAAAASGVAAGVGYLLEKKMTKDIKRDITAWLRERGLAASKLMDAVVLLDMVGSAVKLTLRLTAQAQPTETRRSTNDYTIDEVPDPEVRALLAARQHAAMNVMKLVATA